MGRSAAAKGATAAEPPGRPPRPSHAAPAEPPEPRGEPGPGSLVSTNTPRVNPPQRFSSRVVQADRGGELTQRRSSTSYSSEPVQPPGSTAGRERKKRPPSGGRGPSPGAVPPTSHQDTPTPRSHWSLPTLSRPRPRSQPT